MHRGRQPKQEGVAAGAEFSRDTKREDMLIQMIAEITIDLTSEPFALLDPKDVASLAAEREAIIDSRAQEAHATGRYRNPNVPWDDAQIPYHCECGQITYSDTPCDCPNSQY